MADGQPWQICIPLPTLGLTSGKHYGSVIKWTEGNSLPAHDTHPALLGKVKVHEARILLEAM